MCPCSPGFKSCGNELCYLMVDSLSVFLVLAHLGLNLAPPPWRCEITPAPHALRGAGCRCPRQWPHPPHPSEQWRDELPSIPRPSSGHPLLIQGWWKVVRHAGSTHLRRDLGAVRRGQHFVPCHFLLDHDGQRWGRDGVALRTGGGKKDICAARI